jgi:hypothetical protein
MATRILTFPQQPRTSRCCRICSIRLAPISPEHHRLCKRCWSYSRVARIVEQHREIEQQSLQLPGGAYGERWAR